MSPTYRPNLFSACQRKHSYLYALVFYMDVDELKHTLFLSDNCLGRFEQLYCFEDKTLGRQMYHIRYYQSQVGCAKQNVFRCDVLGGVELQLTQTSRQDKVLWEPPLGPRKCDSLHWVLYQCAVADDTVLVLFQHT